jgi:hypothetical protein
MIRSQSRAIEIAFEREGRARTRTIHITTIPTPLAREPNAPLGGQHHIIRSDKCDKNKSPPRFAAIYCAIMTAKAATPSGASRAGAV